ncbi:hypothetical protein BCR36DRAFT_467782 [Piromyces finnis]|uniref:Uncharacterized protein n=1 Tax=Piromyces finnis TaxID=1754191 RepID=A0A1Y1UWK2_9FUNG|nr:hypothetical protein BCR36DRAFT_467782 [Piromyces finnis]|eukprot:ORX41589.1 hypothetical protein BCR36DRAFT_467782 [Piromyces finnis]
MDNTELFYKELNSTCNPDTLLKIAKKGIFLYEPLFTNNKIKDHENVIEISILAGQYFMIFNRKQYQKLVELISRKDFTIYPHLNNHYIIFNIFIINKYFIEQLMIEKNNDFLLLIHERLSNKITILLYLYKYNYISTKIFYSFYYYGNKHNYFNFVFELYEYFYHNEFKNLFENTFDALDITGKSKIISEMLLFYGRDINIFKYCIKKIKQYHLYIRYDYFRIPLHFPIEYLKEYNDDVFFPNELFVTCEDKKIEEFINTFFSDYFILVLSNNYNDKYKCYERFYSRYNIDIDKLYKFKYYKKKDINLDYIYNSEEYKNFLEGNKNFKGITYNTRDNIINLINIKKENSYFDVLDKKLVFFKYTCEEPYIRKIFNILCSTPHEVFNNYILIKDYNPN